MNKDEDIIREECAGGCGELANYDSPLSGIYWCGNRAQCAYNILLDNSEVLEGREDYT